MMRRMLTLLAMGGVTAMAQSINVEIVNDSGVHPDNVWVLVTGDNSDPLNVSGVTPGTPVKLSGITDQKFTVTNISSGRIYISYNASVTANEPPASTTRYDKVELTYPGAGNLTAVDFFGIPFRVDTLDGSGEILQTLNFYASADTLRKELADLAPGAVIGGTGASFARVLSPTGSPGSYPSMSAYVDKVKNKEVTISGTYVGSVGPSPNSYTYSGTFDSSGAITLTGTMTQAATPNNGNLVIDGTSLASAIYTNNGPYTVNGVAQQVSNNDVYAAIYANLIGAFDFGYVEGKYGSDSSGWYGTTPYNPPYAAARPTADGLFNKYAAVIAANSDAYGFPFSDLNQPVQVALNPGGTSSVATMRITILPDDMLDAPILKTATPTTDSIALVWDSVTGATDYEVSISPPVAGLPVTTTATSKTITGLSKGTPYTVSVVAKNSTKTSAALPIVVTTTGAVTPVTGAVTWNFIPNFTGTFSGHKITFNGTTQTLPGTANPAIQFNGIQAEPGKKNAYVFTWEDGNGKLIYNTILYVTLDASPTSGNGSIDQSPAASFMVANQHLPTWQMGVPFNLFLSIQPFAQRTVPVASPRDPDPATFGPASAVKGKLLQNGRKALLSGPVTDGDGIRSVKVRVGKKTFHGKYRGTSWRAKVVANGRRNIRALVIIEDRLGNTSRHRYKIKL